MKENYSRVNEAIEKLNKEELRLFSIYSRHDGAERKLEVLNKLVVVINQIEVLKLLKQ